MGNPFQHIENQARVRITDTDGIEIEGELQIFGGKRFVIVRDLARPMGLRVEGPFGRSNTTAVIQILSRDAVRAERTAYRLGERIFTADPATRGEFRAQLETIARAIAALGTNGDIWRRHQLEAQFNAVAARIALASAKRAWILAEARWYCAHNHPPSLRDLWGSDVASPSCFRRPRDEDFDPDPVIRNRPTPIPDWVHENPRSMRNMLSALRRANLSASLSRLGDPEHERGELLVRMPCDGRAQFVLRARRDAAGAMIWSHHWDVLDTPTGDRRLRKVRGSAAYAMMLAVLERGLTRPQLDFHRLLRPL